MKFTNIVSLKILLFLLLSLASSTLFSEDLDEIVSGAEVEDLLGKSKREGASPYITENPEHENELENTKIKKNSRPDYIFTRANSLDSVKNDKRKELEDFGYNPPGTFEKNENFIEIDKKSMAKDFRKISSSSFNLSYIKNNFDYLSTNDIINKTISEGFRHIKGGALYLRNDQYFLRTDFLNSFWSLGAGVGYNSGRGLFITGDRSEATFRLWEVPVDAGLGIEIPIYHWFKISGSAGPSVTALYQNRSDYQNGEAGKNKIQVGYGPYANAQFKLNLSGFSDSLAYSLFSESKITNLYLNFEARYQNYNNFQDEIKISGTSFGIGFSFEYL